MGDALRDYGDLEGAKRMQIKAFYDFYTSLGPSHSLTIRSMNNLAVTLTHQKWYGMAEICHRWASFAYEAVLGKDHPDTCTSNENLSTIYNIPAYIGLRDQKERGKFKISPADLRLLREFLGFDLSYPPAG